MAVSSVNSVSGHIQVHDKDGPDDLAIFGSFDGSAKDVGIILSEASGTEQPMQGTGRLIPMHKAEFRNAKWQVPITLDPLIEYL